MERIGRAEQMKFVKRQKNLTVYDIPGVLAIIPFALHINHRSQVQGYTFTLILFTFALAQLIWDSYAESLKQSFFTLARPVLSHNEFQKQKYLLHHTTSTYDHVVRVAFISYLFARLFRLDEASTVRGGLLHDFFLYDWREVQGFDHLKTHPMIARTNADRYFSINEKEADIIATHMFPKTRTFYGYPESFLVSTVDKFAAVWEYLVLHGESVEDEEVTASPQKSAV